LYVAYEGERLGPDVGVVLSAGADSSRELSPGDVVLVNHAHGKHVRGLRIGGVEFENEVRLYGCAAIVGGKARVVPWYKSVMAVLERDGGVRATGRNVVIDRGDVRTVTEGGIHLPDDATFRPSIGTVVSVGPLANPEIKVGMRVVYMATLVKRVEGVRKNLGIVPSEAVLAEVRVGDDD
ncbi:MAG: co-chaperone GroES, partial [Fimbriimonadales bacterium]|nr:co-chaperone GroES [Fimbriimonadales bacterium]